MRYVSTRGGGKPRSFTDILLEGLAPDGGLYLPEEYPQLDKRTLSDFSKLLSQEGYAALAAKVLALYIDYMDELTLARLCEGAYGGGKFSAADIVPATQIGQQMWLGHLSYGPTAAFKDMAMQLLGELFEEVLSQRGQVLNILGATSGDTGSSAEYAMANRRGIKVFMLTPRGRMSPFQQAQMFSLTDPNIFNIAIAGVFDDCQDIVKAISADLEFKRAHHIGAVNSINWARLLAQVVYYIGLYLQVSEKTGAEKVSFCVPTGNFGNVCAGHIARQMGLPIDRLIVATNENNVLEEFFTTGRYRVRSAQQTLATSSPSMDISKASNFERFIFDLLGRDGARCRELFANQLRNSGYFELPEAVFAKISDFGFQSGSSTHANRLEQIRLLDREGIEIDPHTADGVQVAKTQGADLTSPIVVLETALPVKFSQTIREATGHGPKVPGRFADIEKGPRRVVDLENDPEVVKDYLREFGL
ncbi:threonine synthase [Winkia neuii]|uniref:threonine synthase n=1 Tax=Winkia neuii TaxID=33007 RepID=UPI0007642E4B|nr:threonine synthase [Winkia neuii]